MTTYILVGLLAGVSAGWFGIGGGTIIVPALALLAGFSQHSAVGTSLAVLVLPVGILAVINYYRAGHVNVPAAAWIAVGLVLGAYLGSISALKVGELKLKLAFGVFMTGTGIALCVGAVRGLLAKP